MRILKTLLFLSFINSSFAQSDADLTREIAEQRAIWNNALVHDTTARFSKRPNALLVETVKGKKNGKALDIGMGQGRNSIFLAQEGWDVTGIDVADEAVQLAVEKAKSEHVKINTQVASMQQFYFGESEWDLMVHVYEGCLDGDNGKFDKITRALKPGGLLVFEFFHSDAASQLGRQNFGCNAANTKDLLEKSKRFTIIRYSEEEDTADFILRKLKLIKIVARKEN